MNVTIDDAKAIATRRRKPIVLVLAISQDGIEGASYGMTRPQCDFAKTILDGFFKLVEEDPDLLLATKETP